MRLVRESLALAALMGHIEAVAFYWKRLPARVPAHFGITGAADGFGPKGTLLILPAVAFALYTLLTVLCFFPRKFNYPVPVTDGNRERLQALGVSLVGWLKVEVCALFAYLA